ncbi:uncharacterized protein LOC106639935 [Copidosoma floridanum]|uniref:uncharacterized protein LOC106639935 n=1 Tax=Copidosoma floridanum TaxID=29053 RepID=UPI0006C95A2C|nr:uncharacterized protein LOC106639935 [Copidosoma floridanum]
MVLQNSTFENKDIMDRRRDLLIKTKTMLSTLKNSRSNSFDVSILHDCGESKQVANAVAVITNNSCSKDAVPGGAASIISPSSWFAKRHQPMAKKRNGDAATSTLPTALSFKFDKTRVVKAVRDSLLAKATSPTKDGARNKVVWDGSSGTKVDAQVLGNAIEEFLRSGATGGESPEGSQDKAAISPNRSRVGSWFNSGTTQAGTAAAPSAVTTTPTSIGH